MEPEEGVRHARLEDIAAMAALADRKRVQYRDHAAPFQKPAADARVVHEGFLPKLLEWDGFEVLVHENQDREVDGFIVGRFGSAPPPFGEGPLFHVDDFAVADSADWAFAGRALLRALAAEAVNAGIECAIVVSGPASVDAPKADFLAASGLAVAAEWWVKPIEITDSRVPEQEGFDAVVGPAPPVYDPGGLTALALWIDEPSAVERFERFASASSAVVAIVPARVGQLELREELRCRGYDVASEWYSGPSAALLAAAARG